MIQSFVNQIHSPLNFTGKKKEEERNNQLTKGKRQNSKDADESSNEIHEKYQKFHHIMKTNKKKQ